MVRVRDSLVRVRDTLVRVRGKKSYGYAGLRGLLLLYIFMRQKTLGLPGGELRRCRNTMKKQFGLINIWVYRILAVCNS